MHGCENTEERKKVQGTIATVSLAKQSCANNTKAGAKRKGQQVEDETPPKSPRNIPTGSKMEDKSSDNQKTANDDCLTLQANPFLALADNNPKVVDCNNNKATQTKPSCPTPILKQQTLTSPTNKNIECQHKVLVSIKL